MKFCPLTQKDCREDCQLYVNEKCSVVIIAKQQRDTFDTIDEMTNAISNLAAAIIDKKDTL